MSHVIFLLLASPCTYACTYLFTDVEITGQWMMQSAGVCPAFRTHDCILLSASAGLFLLLGFFPYTSLE